MSAGMGTRWWKVAASGSSLTPKRWRELPHTGAHGFSMGYNYNGKLRSAEVLLKEDGNFQLIRRAETPEDYFRTFDCFDILKDMKHPK